MKKIFRILPTDRNGQTDKWTDRQLERQIKQTDKTDRHADIALPMLAHMPGVIILAAPLYEWHRHSSRAITV